MPVTVKKRGGQYRVVEKSTGNIAKTSKGKARDGGGHASRARAGAQAGHINKGGGGKRGGSRKR